jgi:hypothetical protein
MIRGPTFHLISDGQRLRRPPPCPRKIGEQVRAWICAIAGKSSAGWGRHASPAWSLAELGTRLLAEGIVAAIRRETRETLRPILCAGGVSRQTTTTSKASADADFIPKMRRALDLSDHPPQDGRVVCVDEIRAAEPAACHGQGLAAPRAGRVDNGRLTAVPPG